jgi:hypothetical protein
MKHSSSLGWSPVALALALGVAAAPAPGQDKPETYNATASLKTAAGATMTAPVVISIDRWTSDADREKAVAALKSGGTTGLQKQLAGMPAIGTLQVGEHKAPLHFARSLPFGSGKVVTLVASQPVFYVGAGAPDAKAKAGYDVAVVLFQVDAAGKGDVGDFAPAAKVKIDDRGAFVTEDYGAEAVRLQAITKK